jgi:hypothetical protein
MTDCVCSPTKECAYHYRQRKEQGLRLKAYQSKLRKLQRYEYDLANRLYDLWSGHDVPNMQEVKASLYALEDVQIKIRCLAMLDPRKGCVGINNAISADVEAIVRQRQ